MGTTTCPLWSTAGLAPMASGMATPDPVCRPWHQLGTGIGIATWSRAVVWEASPSAVVICSIILVLFVVVSPSSLLCFENIVGTETRI